MIFWRLNIILGSDKFLKKADANIWQIHLGQISQRQLHQQKRILEKLFEINFRNEAWISDVWKWFWEVTNFSKKLTQISDKLIWVKSPSASSTSKSSYQRSSSKSIVANKNKFMTSENDLGKLQISQKAVANIWQTHLGQISQRKIHQQKPIWEKLFEINRRNEE